VAVDSTPVFGRGAVEDTYNLIAHGIRKLCQVLAQVADEEPESWAEGRDLGRYFGTSIKASRDVDWDDEASRQEFLTELLADGQRTLELARQSRSELEEGSEQDQAIARAAALLQ